MKLYHGTRANASIVADFPKATVAMNGVGFYLTNDIEVARFYGKVIEFEVDASWTCSLVRPIAVAGESAIEYVLTQHEADALVVDHALSITIH